MTTRKKVGMGLLAMGVVVGGWLGVAYLVQERWRRITVGRETTFVTGPLRADGTVDYVGAMNERCSAQGDAGDECGGAAAAGDRAEWVSDR